MGNPHRTTRLPRFARNDKYDDLKTMNDIPVGDAYMRPAGGFATRSYGLGIRNDGQNDLKIILNNWF